MKRWLLPTALLLSVGFNLGLLTSFLLDRKDERPEPAEVRSVLPLEVLAPRDEPAAVLAVPGASAPVGVSASSGAAEASAPPVVLAPSPDAREPLTTNSGLETVPTNSARASAQEPVSAPVRPQVSPEPGAPRQEAANRVQERPVVRPTDSQADSLADDSRRGSSQRGGARADDSSPQIRRPAARSGQVRDGVRRRPAQQVEFEKMAERLGLEGAQRDRFMADHLDFTAKVRQIGPRTLRLRRQFFRELSAEQPDEERIKRLTQQLGVANVALERALADVILKTRRHLDKAQQQAYLRFIQGRMDRLQEFVRRGAAQRPSSGLGTPRQRQRNPGQLRQRQIDERPDPPRF